MTKIFSSGNARFMVRGGRDAGTQFDPTLSQAITSLFARGELNLPATMMQKY